MNTDTNIAKLIIGTQNGSIVAKNYIKKLIDKKEHKLVDLLQHPNVLWLKPSSELYINDDLEMLFEHVKYIRDVFFIVIEQADKLTEHNANKLLKIIEEPPAGYHFLLLACQATTILPTIRSRCLEIYVDTQTSLSSQTNELERLFLEAIEGKFDAYKLSQLEKNITTEDLDKAIWAAIRQKPELFFKFKFYFENSIMSGSAKIALKAIYATLLDY